MPVPASSMDSNCLGPDRLTARPLGGVALLLGRLTAANGRDGLAQVPCLVVERRKRLSAAIADLRRYWTRRGRISAKRLQRHQHLRRRERAVVTGSTGREGFGAVSGEYSRAGPGLFRALYGR